MRGEEEKGVGRRAHLANSFLVPVEVQLRPRPRMRRMALIDGVDFTIPLDANANAVLVYSPSTTVAAAIDEVQSLSGIREPSLELFVRYNISSSASSYSSSSPSSPSLGALSPTIFNGAVNSRLNPYFSGNGAAERDKGGSNGGSGGSLNKLYVERVCLEFGKTLWSYNFLPTSTLEIFVEDEEKRDTEVLEEQALKAFGGHLTSFLPGTPPPSPPPPSTFSFPSSPPSFILLPFSSSFLSRSSPPLLFFLDFALIFLCR